jgi:hypothetical protein
MVNIANLATADRRTATAGEAMSMGMVVKVSDDGAGGRKLMKLADADSAEVASGKFAVVYKVTADALRVDSSTVPNDWGSRLVTIASGDLVVEVRKGAIIEYTLDELDVSLTSGGAPNCAAGEALQIKGSKFCKAGTSGAITTLAGRCYDILGNNIRVELVY